MSRSASTPPTAHRSWARTYLPPQHGAWAMLLAPFLMGTLASSWTVWSLPLLLAWLDGYLLSYYALQAWKTRRVGRFAAPLRAYAALFVPLAALLVWAHPWLLVAAAGFLPFTAVNAWYARRRDERALVNGLVSVTQGCLMVFVAYGVGDGDDWRRAAVLYAAAWLYFAGTVFYVKTMIREKGDPTFLGWSLGFHVVALVVAAVLEPWLALPFALDLGRAWLMPHLARTRTIRPGRVGVVEIGNTLLVVVVALVATAP